MTGRGYFDHNATTPLAPEAREAWLRMQDRHWHNPSSLYQEAAAARQALEECREDIAEHLGTDPERLVFTSGATESNNALMQWLAGSGTQVVISPFEHPSLREPARSHADARALPAADLLSLPPFPGLISAMPANNETGLLHDWSEAARRQIASGGAWHADAAQWLGKMPARSAAPREAALTGSGHKFGGPKGVGFLVLPAGCRDFQGLRGGPQEEGRRAGTENLPAVAAMRAALQAAERRLPGDPLPRDTFEHEIGWEVVGAALPRLWNTSMVIAPRHDNRLWLARLSQRGFQCSTGSACSSGLQGDSQVLHAMGLSPDQMRRVLRFSSGHDTTLEDWLNLAAALRQVLTDLDRR